jgi:hypothetical protein
MYLLIFPLCDAMNSDIILLKYQKYIFCITMVKELVH